MMSGTDQLSTQSPVLDAIETLASVYESPRNHVRCAEKLLVYVRSHLQKYVKSAKDRPANAQRK